MLNNLLKNSRLNIEQLTGIKKEPQRMGKHLRIIFGSLLIIIIAGIAFWLSSPHQIVLKDSAKFVAVAKVTRSDLSRSVTISGEMKPYQEIALFFSTMSDVLQILMFFLLIIISNFHKKTFIMVL